MPSLNRLWSENKDKGLHIFHLESQGHSKAEIEAFCKKNNVEFTNTVGRGGFNGYEGDNGLPYTFVIGVEGKVVFQGRGDYKAKVHEELTKVRYPGLGKLSVAKDVHKSALLFGQKQFGKAKAEAADIVAKAEEGKEIPADSLSDAKYVLEKVAKRAESFRSRIDRYKEERDYDLALLELRKLEVFFKGDDLSKQAKSESKDLSKDPEVKKELKALAALEQVLSKLERKDADERRNTLEAFGKKFEGTRAAERAKSAS